MIRENQRFLNQLNVITDALLICLMMPLAYWLRFGVLHGVENVPRSRYLIMGAAIMVLELFLYAARGVYQTTRVLRIRREAANLLETNAIIAALLLGWLYLNHDEHYSRLLLLIFFVLSAGGVTVKHVAVRKILRALRKNGRNLKHVVVLGGGRNAGRYLAAICDDREIGFDAIGYVAARRGELPIPYLGGFDALDTILDHTAPDEVVSAIESADYELTPHIIACCEKAGVKLSVIPPYAEYMPAHPEFDDVGGIPLLNIRRIPLDNYGNAMVKRGVDIVGALLMLTLLSPLMAICAVGVKLSSPGPVFFAQERIGKDKKPFTMYKFRSLVVNDASDTAWSGKSDSRRTAFGAWLRRCSLDELPQLFNVLRGDMSLVGPRPEIPYYVHRFKEEVPLYMVRHQVRPGMTGWAQIHGYRGDTPIPERVKHDVWYIENWSLWLDFRIMLETVFRGKFMNNEAPGAK
ncbi:MAG: undecaprenyl-phosphate glucose phosphotransferase [Oscillospiraceae bacterium]|nr:undecaprenyl-phosphate glucose phosphotransferase [Oscillospiraceae bacterium]MBR0211336.1 undecaprenyl-phosphate glucose phosphotransferase [Oscillospiraceae bacterium]